VSVVSFGFDLALVRVVVVRVVVWNTAFFVRWWLELLMALLLLVVVVGGRKDGMTEPNEETVLVCNSSTNKLANRDVSRVEVVAPFMVSSFVVLLL